MRSIFLVLAFGAVAHASEECADESTLLQGGIRGRKVKKHTDANSVLKSLQHLSSAMTKEGFKNTLSKDTVDDALASANSALESLTPTIQASVVQAQQQVDDAASAVMVCHAAEGIEQRTALQGQVDTFQAQLATCQSELQGLTTAATNQCNIAQDCLCDEANERRDGKAEVCAALTVTYEVAWCESNLACTTHTSCHATEMGVYMVLRADIEAEMATIQQEYIATQQSTCLMGLIMTAMATGTPIDASAQVACLTVDASAIAVTYPTLPAEPAACPAAAIGNPQCAGISCPAGWDQKGSLGADIGGCGLQGCDERYDLSSASECAARCDATWTCQGFSWAPMDGDRNHPGVAACTIYNSDTPTGSWTGVDGTAQQVFCGRSFWARLGSEAQGTVTCSAGVGISQEDCWEAGQRLIPTGGVSAVQELRLGSWSHVPTGCIVRYQNFNVLYNSNTNPNGNTDDWVPICSNSCTNCD